MKDSTKRLYEAALALRQVHGQGNVARLLGESQQMVWAWEQRGVSRRGALKAQAVLGANAHWILTGEGAMTLEATTGASPAPAPVTPPAPAAANVERLRAALRQAGAATASQLQQLTGLQASELEAAAAVLLQAREALMAAGPEANYVAPRLLPDITATGTIPIMKVDERGKPSEFATLVPTTGGRYWIEERAGEHRLHAGLPWFLQDMSPQGFLGRAFALAHPSLSLPDHPQYWTDDQMLRALCLAGEDLPGNLIVGSRSFERYLQAPKPAPVGALEYPQLATAAMHGSAPASSAGGEQPKFCCVRPDGTPVLVKFSPPQGSALGQRWSDLLVCEHLALEHLAAAGIPAARSRIHREGGRTFLEVERFDRTPRGRIGMVSLRAYDSEYVGHIDNWAASAERMVRAGLLTPQDAQRLRFLEAFGMLIANSDRHYGNVSLLIDSAGDWTLAPAYDQLPMRYAPVAGEIVDREFSAAQPTADTLAVWENAAHVAVAFWRAAAQHELVSAELRGIAQQHLHAAACVNS